jgi:hypothetical protein
MLAAAILDRLLHRGIVVAINGPPIACALTSSAPKRCTPVVNHDPTRLRHLRSADHRHHSQPQPAVLFTTLPRR